MAGNYYGKRGKEKTGAVSSTRVSNSTRNDVQTIPSLERQQIVEQYESAKPTYNLSQSPLHNLSNYMENMKTRQALANDYNAIKNQQTADTLARLGQTDTARGSNSFAVEQAKQGHLMSGLLNAFADNEKFGNLTTFLAGAAPGYSEFRRQQNEAMKGTLTNEMKSAGLTQEDIDRWNRQQNQIEREQVLSNYAKEHPVLSTLNAFPENIAGSTEGNIDKVINYLTGKPLESKPTNAELYRNAVSEEIDSDVGKLAYGGVNSIGDMMLAALLTRSISGGAEGAKGLAKLLKTASPAAAVMGLEKSDQFMNDAIDRGLTPNQIMAEGGGSFATTFLTELMPFSRFGEGGHILGSMLAEGLQEGSEDIADTILDEIVTRFGGNNEKSAYNQIIQSYRDAGYSEEDAKKAAQNDYEKQLLIDAGMGAITGGLMQGGSNFINRTNVITGKPKIPSLNTEENTEAQVEDAVKSAESENADPEAMEFLRNLARETSEESQNWETREEQLNRIESEVANEVAAEKEKVIADLENQNPTAGEAVWNFEKYINNLIQQNPEMEGYLTAELNDVQSMAEGWVTDFDRYRQNQPTEYSDNVFDSREEAQDYLNNLSAEDNVANAIERAKEEVIGRLDTNDPLAGEMVNDFIERMNYIAETNPSMRGVVNNAINEVNAKSEGWVTNYSSNQNNIQAREKQARKAVDKFINSVQSGKVTNVSKARNSLMKTLTNYGNKIPELQPTLNSMWQEANQAIPTDIDKITNVEDAKIATESELEKLDRALNYNLNFFNEGKQTIPSVEDNGVHTGIYKDSKLATNTFPNSGVMTEEEYDSVIPEDIRQTERVTHEATLNKAEENIKDKGYANEEQRLLDKENWDAVDVDTAMLCAFKAAEDARNAEALGVDPNEAWGREVKIFKKARNLATVGGQMIEAFKKWSAMTAEGKLAQAISYVNEAVKEVKNENALPKDVKTAAERYLSDEVMAEFLKKAHQYDGQNPTLLQQARLNAELAHMINEQIPVKFRQKFRSLWMNNLLASFRTLGSRNFGGNTGKAALDQTIVKMISGPIDKFVSKYTGTRTTTGFTMEGLKLYGKEFGKGAKQTVKDYWTPDSDPNAELKLKDLAKEIDVFADANVTNRPGVDELNFKEALNNNRTTFKNKAFKLYDKIIKFGLAIGDNPFYRGTYKQTEFELKTLREQGKLNLPEDITDAEFEQWVKACATVRGLEAVYQDSSKLAQGAMDIKNGLAKVSEGFMGFDPLSNTSMPFVSTPMNVVKSNLELSPLGIVKNVAQTIKEIRSNLENGRSAFDTQSFDQQRFVRETSRNIVGTLLFAAGLMLKNAGMLTGGYSDDPREKQAQKDAGMQEYALVSPFTGNQWSINWIPGMGSTFVAASAFDDAFRKPDQDTADALLSGAKAGAQSLFEQAALQGLQRLTGSANYNTDNKIVDNVVETIANTASSAIVPAFVRQSAAALDPYKRNTYGAGGKESVINNAIAGIPFLRQTLEPRIGLNGQPMEQNAGRNVLEKWFDNLVNPAMVTVPSAMADPVRDEATRLYNSTGSVNAYQPKIGIKSLTTEDHIPTTAEYTEFLQIADSAMNQVASDFIQSDYYQTLTDEQRVESLNGIYSAIQSVERAKYLDIEKDFSGAAKAYYEGGAQGLMDYFRAKDTLSNMGAQNNPQNRELITETINNGTFDEMEQLGFDVNLIKKYQHAADRLPSLNPTTFQQQFNAIDTSGNNSITQDEVIAYLNQNPSGYNEEDALKLWDAYLQNYKKIPVLDPNSGTWSAK